MPVPDWADERLSEELAVLRARGENQDSEYMASFPEQARDLGKEIAAFATSNQGMILLGVSDSGDLIGLMEGLTPKGRDSLLRRVEGVCRGTIKPAVTPTAKWAVEHDKTVLVLLVPKGSQPVYYIQGVPYIRHITESRPAEPHEIIDLMRQWLPIAPPDEEGPDEYFSLISRIGSVLIDVIIFGEEVDERMINPWLDMWRSQFQQAATEFREMSSLDVTIENELATDLTDLADALDDVANMRVYLGCGEELDKKIHTAFEKAVALRRDRIEQPTLSESFLATATEALATSARKLSGLADRAVKMIEAGRIEEVQSEASDAGYSVLKVAHYVRDHFGPEIGRALKSVGRDLHLIETARLYMDGGRSMQAILDRVKENSERLSQLASQIKG